MRTLSLPHALPAVLLFLSAMSAQDYASLVLNNAKVWTEDPNSPEAEALAIEQNKILGVGTTAEISRFVGPGTRVIDLHGKRVVPGFNDAHVHFFMGGEGLAGVQLHDANSPSEFRDKIAQFARSRKKGAWILNGNWDHERWIPASLPTHGLIDDVTGDNPVFVSRSDGHMSLANTLAMKLAGVDEHTKDVPGGVIVRDSAGLPTGVFKDAAKGLIERVIPLPSEDDIIEAVKAAQDYAARNGVTSVQDMGIYRGSSSEARKNLMRAYQTLYASGQLKVRISFHTPLKEWQKLEEVGIEAGFGNDKLHIGGLKGFADGSLGSTTAWFSEPYNDSPGTSGIPSDELQDPDSMYRNIQGADRAGLQIAIHAIGDRANKTILDLYERLERDNGSRDRRLRIEHAQHLSPAEIPRFAKLHVIASVQPYHAIDDGRWAQGRIGAERIKTTYAFRSLLDSGAMLALGSDWFVAPMEPLLGIYAAVTRRTLDGKNPQGWVAEQKITVREAIHGYTVGSAYASGEEKIKGSIEPGKLADLAVLSNDILAIDPIEIQNTKVDLTIFDGTVIYERK